MEKIYCVVRTDTDETYTIPDTYNKIDSAYYNLSDAAKRVNEIRDEVLQDFNMTLSDLKNVKPEDFCDDPIDTSYYVEEWFKIVGDDTTVECTIETVELH